ncbi:MAG: aldehyde dehydrogenase family protein [Chitinophagaceae bacterium]|nr:aldehyde dehydrogenase family protein [Chitinophagaceae bacterium]
MESYNYGKIINEKQFNRLAGYLQHGNILHGGRTNIEKLFIELRPYWTKADMGSAIMNEEIFFGPILPVITFSTREDARLKIIALNKTLWLLCVYIKYCKRKGLVKQCGFWRRCVNNASWHLTNHHLPFGGRGLSGSGTIPRQPFI